MFIFCFCGLVCWGLLDLRGSVCFNWLLGCRLLFVLFAVVLLECCFVDFVDLVLDLVIALLVYVLFCDDFDCLLVWVVVIDVYFLFGVIVVSCFPVFCGCLQVTCVPGFVVCPNDLFGTFD